MIRESGLTGTLAIEINPKAEVKLKLVSPNHRSYSSFVIEVIDFGLSDLPKSKVFGINTSTDKVSLLIILCGLVEDGVLIHWAAKRVLT